MNINLFFKDYQLIYVKFNKKLSCWILKCDDYNVIEYQHVNVIECYAIDLFTVWYECHYIHNHVLLIWVIYMNICVRTYSINGLLKFINIINIMININSRIGERILKHYLKIYQCLYYNYEYKTFIITKNKII